MCTRITTATMRTHAQITSFVVAKITKVSVVFVNIRFFSIVFESQFKTQISRKKKNIEDYFVENAICEW